MEFYPAKPGNASESGPVRAELWNYSLPLAKPIFVAGKKTECREGFLAGLRTASGAEGWGEIAPLEGLFPEKMKEAGQRASDVLKRIEDSKFSATHFQEASFESAFFLADSFWKKMCPDFNQYPSVRSGFEMALCSLAASCQKKSILNWMNGKATSSGTKTSLLLEAGSDSFLHEGEAAYTRGFRVFKLKIGRADARLEQEAVRLFLEGRADIRLRLDANRKLNELQFEEWLDVSARWSIEYWEEPLANTEALSRFDAPFAVDESLRAICSRIPVEGWENEFVKLPQNIGIWIVKPALLGSMRLLAPLSELAVKLNKKLVLSSTFESRLGLSFWAEASGAFEKSSADLVAGLGTLGYFSADLCRPEKRAEPEFESRQKPFAFADLDLDRIRRIR